MYQNCCKKCGSVDLFSKEVGNNIGLYCSDCGAWIKWMGKDESNAFQHTQESKKETKNLHIVELAKSFKQECDSTSCYKCPFYRKEYYDSCELSIEVDGYDYSPKTWNSNLLK